MEVMMKITILACLIGLGMVSLAPVNAQSNDSLLPVVYTPGNGISTGHQ